MPMQVYLIHPIDNASAEAREVIAEHVARVNGFILMSTTHGSLIAAFDDRYLSAVQSHQFVKFVGGVTLNPNAPGAAALRQLFAHNVALQFNSRGHTAQSAEPSFPPGYRPLKWPARDDSGS